MTDYRDKRTIVMNIKVMISLTRSMKFNAFISQSLKGAGMATKFRFVKEKIKACIVLFLLLNKFKLCVGP